MASSPPARSTTLLPPPRPISSPPPWSASRPPAAADASPASGRRHISSVPPFHEELNGANGTAVRFRPTRLNSTDLPANLACRFRCDGVFVGPLTVLDLSTAGLAAEGGPQLALPPGSVLESFEILVGDQPIWTGDAVVVHGSAERIGARFTSGVLDLHHLRLGATIDGRLASHAEQCRRLPAEWRAAVGDLRLLVEGVRLEMDELERAEAHDPLRWADEEAKLFERTRASWGGSFYASAAALHAMSASFDRRTAALGRSYATAMLMPIMMACPLHRRAYEKPLGYAGDYRMMELCFAREPGGEGLFGRFLHTIGQNYTLARAVVAREAVTREAIHAAVAADGDGPVRILALAAGAAIELRRFLEQTGPLRRPVELILLDQDRGAHETAHRHLTRALLERHHGILPVTVECLHFSVRQLLRPQTPEEERVVRETLAGLDLVYSSGLYDYLPERVAGALTQLLYSRIREGGRLLLGNLVETPDSTWIMDYVWGWPLVYRTVETMLRLAEGLMASGSRVGITRDATGRCLFLDVVKPSSV
jgi:extracellular factor (EF) 3-hydroxypalmitic acid methyl ester biosynthesis protein